MIYGRDGFLHSKSHLCGVALKEKECREITICYDFAPDSGTCQLIYISPDLEETVLAENEDGSVTVRLQPGANYIGIYGNDYSGSIQITIE